MSARAYDFQFTERDGEIIAAVARYRFLKTSQIRALVFPENSSPQSARRRLRYLSSASFLRRTQPPLTGQGKPDAVYLLDKVGHAYAQHRGYELPKYGRFKETSLPFLTHALALSEFRIQLEHACAAHPHIQLHRFISDFELKAGQKGLRGQHRFRLFESMDDPRTGKSVTLYPDALIILAGTGAFEGRKRLYALEIDRGTENHSVIADKLRGYELAQSANHFAKFGVQTRPRILFQVPSPGRRAQIIDRFVVSPLATDVWLGLQSDVTAPSLLTTPIWRDLTGADRAMLKQG